ncbi:hypothetical protein KKC00_03360, partial [Patescibacteria group bacterium]|nr:hypothetical protein [Patescibacteria group bacterium]
LLNVSSETTEVQKFEILFKVPTPKTSLFLIIGIVFLVGLVLSLIIEGVNILISRRKNRIIS